QRHGLAHLHCRAADVAGGRVSRVMAARPPRSAGGSDGGAEESMTNDEFRMPNQSRNPNSEARMKWEIRNPEAESNERQALCSDFGLRASWDLEVLPTAVQSKNANH